MSQRLFMSIFWHTPNTKCKQAQKSTQSSHSSPLHPSPRARALKYLSSDRIWFKSIEGFRNYEILKTLDFAYADAIANANAASTDADSFCISFRRAMKGNVLYFIQYFSETSFSYYLPWQCVGIFTANTKQNFRHVYVLTQKYNDINFSSYDF